jgi:predicted RecA/RadA family phage recombinase
LKNAILIPSNVVTLTAPYDRLSGQGALVGSQFGVAVSDVLNTVAGQFLIKGAVTLDATSAQAWNQGDPIYWDNTNKRCDNTAVGPRIGTALNAKANPSATGDVLIGAGGSAGSQSALIAQIATANATDLATSEALANQLKTTVNALLTALINAGLMKNS